ncbi:hypothetical protein Ssi03_62030 [Sphaerisporangium siamense]|uniref:Uncharacterized protein n=1 Tax=Sphaerisporangium siamense TaxID=795645 RepID=A0A7W7D9M0_9ACTN|nr:hypothetical protein [Sphaerisporangium siamense]MBB4702514.1 hypothetical protein [Sphaerisporangium siamense]GII88213.1 hypothetical protein Ssi03_62030 [Sphaerisporangium siamense]
MIHMFKGRNRRGRTEHTESVQPPQGDRRAAEASQDAAGVVNDIDEVLADAEQAAEEAERDKAHAEFLAFNRAFQFYEVDEDEYDQWHQVWTAQYGHLFRGCGC